MPAKKYPAFKVLCEADSETTIELDIQTTDGMLTIEDVDNGALIVIPSDSVDVFLEAVQAIQAIQDWNKPKGEGSLFRNRSQNISQMLKDSIEV